MDLQTVLFYGRSGSGKGTQAVLLREYLEKHDSEHRVIHFETGKTFRALAEADSPAGKLTKDALHTGNLLPSFFAIWLLGDFFIRK